MRRFSSGAGDLKADAPLVTDFVPATGVPQTRRLGRPVKVPEEELAFVTEEALEETLAPEALNSGNVVDIYQHREEDFLATSTLEVSYHDDKGQKIVETLFVDNLYPQSYPRICVAAHAVQAMHRAISVLTRKVDNLTMTLRTCREHYYKELFFLRHGRPPEQEHEVYWFSPKAYEDMVTKDIMRERLSGREKKLQEALDQKDKELDRLRLSLDTDDDVGGLRKVVANMPVSKLFKFLKIHNASRQAEFYAYMERTLEEFKGKPSDWRAQDGSSEISSNPYEGKEIVERLEAAEREVKLLQDNFTASKTRNTMLCKQIRGFGGIPGLLEQDERESDEEEEKKKKQSEQQAELERMRREERLKLIEENEQARREGREHSYAEIQELRRQVMEGKARSEAWQSDAQKLMERLRFTQKELDEKTRDLRMAKKTIEKIWTQDNNVQGKLHARRTVKAGTTHTGSSSPASRTVSKGLSLPDDSKEPSSASTSRAGSKKEPRRTIATGHPTKRRLIEDMPPRLGEDDRRNSESRGLRALWGGGAPSNDEEEDEEFCTCGAPLDPDAAFCGRCGVSRQELENVQPEGRRRERRPSSAPLERSRRFSLNAAPGRRDDWWKELSGDYSVQVSQVEQEHSQSGGSLGRPSAAERQWDMFRVRLSSVFNLGLEDAGNEEDPIEALRKRFEELNNNSSSTHPVDRGCQTDDDMSREVGQGRRGAMQITQDFGEYVVFNGGGTAESRGLMYCSQKARNSVRNISARWGSTVIGVDEGDGWVKVGDHYLPKQLDGRPVLIRQFNDEYRLCDKAAAESKAQGLLYQASKEMGESQSGNFAPWGSVVIGADAGDGFIRVGDRYLPRELGGIPVLSFQPTESWLVFDGHPELEAPGLPYCLRKRLDTATKTVVPWGAVVTGADEGDGWIKVGEQYLAKVLQGAAMLLMQAPEDFVVGGRPLGNDKPGIPLCMDKKLDTQCGWSDWGSDVRGCDQGDGWVKVGELFVPKSLDGEVVLHREVQGNFIVTNLGQQVGISGVPYCSTKSLEDEIGVRAEWDTVVNGFDEGDGWVKVGDFYLPKELEGIPVLKREETYDFLVANGHPEVQSPGLPYCLSKELHPRYGKVARWRGSIRGTSEGDGWIKVGDSFLPEQDNGKQLLVIQEREDFVVCDGHPGFQTPGLPFCEHHDLDTGNGIIANWGSIVEGVDEDNGWVRSGELYLPKIVDGVQVLRPQAKMIYTVCDSHPDIRGEGLPFYQQKREAAKCFGRVAPWGSTVKGWDEENGWVKVGNRYLPKEINGIAVLALHRKASVEVQAPSRAGGDLGQSPRHGAASADPELEPEPDGASPRSRAPSARSYSTPTNRELAELGLPPDGADLETRSWGGASQAETGWSDTWGRRPSPVAEERHGEAGSLHPASPRSPRVSPFFGSQWGQRPLTPSNSSGLGTAASPNLGGSAVHVTFGGIPLSPTHAGGALSPPAYSGPDGSTSPSGSTHEVERLRQWTQGFVKSPTLQRPASRSPDGSGLSEASGPPAGNLSPRPAPSQAGSRPGSPRPDFQIPEGWQKLQAPEDPAEGAAVQEDLLQGLPVAAAAQGGFLRQPLKSAARSQPEPDLGPAGPRLELPQSELQAAEGQADAGSPQEKPLQPPMRYGKVGTPMGTVRSITPATRTPTPATWLPSVGSVEESRAGSSATMQIVSPQPQLVSRPVSNSGVRVRTMNVEVQTIVGFSDGLPGWLLPTPHPSMKKGQPEAYQHAVWMRYNLMKWCINFIAVLDPGLLSEALLEAAMRHVHDNCMEVTTGKRPGDEFVKYVQQFHSASSASVKQAQKDAQTHKAAKGHRLGSKPTPATPVGSRPTSRNASKAKPAEDLPMLATRALAQRGAVVRAEHSEDDRYSQMAGFRQFQMGIPHDVACQTEASMAGIVIADMPAAPAVKGGRKSLAMGALGGMMPEAGRKSLAVRKSLASGRFNVFGGSACPLCGKVGMGMPKAKHDSDDSSDDSSPEHKPAPEKPQGLKPKAAIVEDKPKERKKKGNVGFSDIKDIAELADNDGASSGSEANRKSLFNENEGRPFAEDTDEVAGGANEVTFSPLKLTELVNSSWPGFFQAGGGSFITAQSMRDKKMQRGRWRQEVAKGGVSARGAETIVQGRRRTVTFNGGMPEEGKDDKGPDVADVMVSGTLPPRRPDSQQAPRRPDSQQAPRRPDSEPTPRRPSQELPDGAPRAQRRTRIIVPSDAKPADEKPGTR